MQIEDPNGITWRCSEACVDYAVFTTALPELSEAQWDAAVERLRSLGRTAINQFGVTTVFGPWGYFVVPCCGFPELKATFFRRNKLRQDLQLLDDISAALQGLDE